jgi:hypothetical protein
MPSATWYGPAYYGAGVTIGTNTYNWIINSSGNYYISDLSKPLYVNGNARLLIITKLSLLGASGRIHIAPGSSLSLYAYCRTATIGGAGVVNSTGFATNFAYIGLSSNSNFTYSASGNFVGTVHAPYADFTLGGSDGSTNHLTGSIVAKSLRMTDPYRFHFDENLARVGPTR